jgi:hypothetical protein
MTPVWKETLIPGRMHDPKTGREFTITPTQVKQAHANVKLMLSRGVPIPLVFEHVDLEAGDPDEWRANYARFCFGHVGASRISPTGTLELRHDVVDDSDIPTLRKCKFVSPKIRPSGWMDSRGHSYTGAVLTHSALTPSPVQYWQKPFELSDSDALYLAYTPPEKKIPTPRKSSSRPAYGESFTDWSVGLDLSALDSTEGSTVADDNDADDVGGDDDTGGGMAGDLKMLVKALKARGINVSDKVGTLKELIIAVESNGDAEMDAEPEPEPEPVDTTAAADDATTGAGGPPMVMSTLDANPVRRKRAVNAAKPEREDAAKELKALFEKGMMTPTEFRLLDRQNRAFEMSFTADLEPAGKWLKVQKKLEEIRKRKARVWTASAGGDGTNLSTVDVDAPANLLGKTMTPERAQLGCDIILGKKSVSDA